MLISNSYSSHGTGARPESQRRERSALRDDRASLEYSSPEADRLDIGARAFVHGLVGATPVLGAAANAIQFLILNEGDEQRDEQAALKTAVGAVANSLGTYALVAGIGSSTPGVMLAGLGLLGVSSFTAAQTSTLR